VRRGLDERIRAVARYAASQEAVSHQLKGEFVRLDGSNIAATLARYVRESQATEVVLGHRRRTRWRPMDTTSELIRRLAGVDVHILRAREPVSGAPDAIASRNDIQLDGVDLIQKPMEARR
jgi:K+-sensing histidine kinase KdpD